MNFFELYAHFIFFIIFSGCFTPALWDICENAWM